jgi:peptidoglycan/xylan/chitin deacetylase (PgdA/CDA1 family)
MNQLGRRAPTVGQAAKAQYPGFVFGLPLGRGGVPVFGYRDVSPAQLTADLEFLSHNRYRTLSLDEFIEARKARRAPARCVLLTFDDARKSFWDTALPLLRAYSARATVFAPTYWMSHLPRHPKDNQFMSWDQLRECVNTGLIDVQSHGHRRALIYTSGELQDFAAPDSLSRLDTFDWPLRGVDELEELGRPELGTPIYTAAPLLSASSHYLEHSTVTKICRDFVRGREMEFFARPRQEWQMELRKLHAKYSRRFHGRQAVAPEMFALVQSELERSRDEFCRHLGYRPSYFAYPWTVGSNLSIEIVRAAGIRAAFGMALNSGDARRCRRLQVPVFSRLHGNWLRYLPGKRRANVFGALFRKVTHFGTPLQDLAH